jgi:membrane protein implicated in regulation of membrane protease activity
MSQSMYGAFAGMSFGLVALIALLVIALAVFASPLIAVIIFLVVGLFLLIGMSALRQRSRQQDQTQGGAPDTHAGGPGRAAGRHPGGEPASGEG